MVLPIKGHVSFRGKNGIKGEVVMRKTAKSSAGHGAPVLTVSVREWSAPAAGCRLVTAAYGAGDVLKMGISGGASKAAQTLSDYYIKRAEQYHPVIPSWCRQRSDRGVPGRLPAENRGRDGAGTHAEQSGRRRSGKVRFPVPPSAESHLNGFNTDQMLKQLGNLNPQQFMSGSQGGGNDGK